MSSLERATEYRRRAFVDAFLGPAQFNVGEAARAAGYKGKPQSILNAGWKLMCHPEVQDLLRRRAAAAGIEGHKVLALLWAHMNGSMADFVTTEGAVLLDLERARKNGHLSIVKKFKQKTRSWFVGEGEDAIEHKETTIEVELYDAQAAADKLAKTLGLYLASETERSGVTTVDEDKLIDRLLRFKIPRSEWLPGLVRRYEARTKQVSSKEVG